MMTKNLMINLRKSAMLVLAAIAMFSPAFANVQDPAEVILKISKERKLVLTIPRIEGRAEVRLTGPEEGILFQETAQEGRYARIFDLSKMVPGAYSVAVSVNGKEVAQPFTVLEKGIDFDPGKRSVVVLPQIKIEEDAVEVRMSSSRVARMRVAIVSQEGELVYEDVIPATTSLQRRYNVKRLPKGAYTVSVHTPQRVLYQSFNR